jgi:hypothetical protein
MSLRRDESADHVIRTSIGWYEAGALSLTANSKKICPPQWYRLAAAVLLQHAVILFILLPNAHLLTIGYRPEFTTVTVMGATQHFRVSANLFGAVSTARFRLSKAFLIDAASFRLATRK